MVLFPGEECALRIGSGGRVEKDWFTFVEDKGWARVREREGDDEGDGLKREVDPQGGVLIVGCTPCQVS